jgi:L-ascorbate metabolism protein UlaG (beta-lactamase superfamily)
MKERPQTGDMVLRKDCFLSIDNLVEGQDSPLNPEIITFYKPMIEKAIKEIKAEVVTEGATIWQLYNHGFVVKTPTSCIGFDLHDYFNMGSFKNLADVLDIYFISHEHGDHFSGDLIQQMMLLKKRVVVPAEAPIYANTKMGAGTTLNIAGLKVTAHDGLHNVPLRQFELETSEGIKILHTGDNQTASTLPDINNVDILLLNGWVNESGYTSPIVGIRNSIEKLNPALTLPGHIWELAHIVDNNNRFGVEYEDMFKIYNWYLPSEYIVLAWGERYHYGNVDDTIMPSNIQSIDYHIIEDNLILSWESPLEAEDGDTASFYRIIHEGQIDKIISESTIELDVSQLEGNQHFICYAYDDCGNQSDRYLCIDVNLSNQIPDTLFKIYPNPVHSSLTIINASPVTNTIKILSTNGQVMMNKDLFGAEQHLDLSFLPSGIYCLIVHSDSFSNTRKFVKY